MTSQAAVTTFRHSYDDFLTCNRLLWNTSWMKIPGGAPGERRKGAGDSRSPTLGRKTFSKDDVGKSEFLNTPHFFKLLIFPHFATNLYGANNCKSSSDLAAHKHLAIESLGDVLSIQRYVDIQENAPLVTLFDGVLATRLS